MSGRLILVYGGSGSGKSAWAERTLLSEAAAAGGRAVYLATLPDAGDEAAARIARHRAMRSRHGAAVGLDFVTAERQADIGGAAVLPGDFVLLEDLGNLLANEIWPPTGTGAADVEARVLAGLRVLLDRAALLVIVSNDIFADGGGYDPDTMAYIRSLGALHRELALLAEQVVEVVCGIPLVHAFQKGG